MLKKLISFTFALAALTVLFSCGNKGSVENTKQAIIDKVYFDPINENAKDRTIMYYNIGSDLEENSLAGTEIISNICKYKYPDNMNFIMMTGGSLSENVELTRKDPTGIELYSKYYDINWEKNQIWDLRDGHKLLEEDFGNEDMTDGKTLQKFILYVKKNFPAKKYDIIFSDHGGAGLYGFGTDTRYASDNGCLSMRDLEEAFNNSHIKFETVGFDACLMASFELMNTISPYTDYLIAAEETSFGGWDYSFLEKVVNDVNINPVEYGKAVVDAFMANNDANANSLGVYNLNGFRDTVDGSLSEFSKCMNKYLTEDDFLESLYAILKETIGLGYTTISDVRDLRDFLYWIAYVEEYPFPQDLRDSARDLWDTIDPFVIYYRTHKQKYDEGDEKTGGINFVFPIENIYYSDDEDDTVLYAMKNYPESLNEDYRLMFKLAFLRKALVKETKNYYTELDNKKVTEALNNLCKKGLEKYKIPKEYIDSIEQKIVPNLSENRIKSGEGGNVDFEKVVNNNTVSFNFKFNEDIAWMIYEPVATARTYAFDGRELKLGDALVPRKETKNGKETTWTITPEEDRWFSIASSNGEKVVAFIVTEDEKKDNDPANLNYLFDKSITGFIPAIIKRYENDKDEDNIIMIHVQFTGNSKEGKVLGFTRYDQNANMSAKDLEDFKPDDEISYIANFEDFKSTKNISYLYYGETKAADLKVSRGPVRSQSVYFKYSMEDIYGEIYEFDVPNLFAFEKDDGSNVSFYATFPSTWTDVTFNSNDSSFESMSVLGDHVEKFKIDVFDVTNDTKNFGDVKEGEEFPETTIAYLSQDKLFSEIIDVEQNVISDTSNRSLPIFDIEGIDKNNNVISKKYMFFESDGRKYLIEMSSSIDENQKDYASRHDIRLIRSAYELVNTELEKSDDIPTQKITERPAS